MNKAVMAMATVVDTMLSAKTKGQGIPQANPGECIKTVLDAITLIGVACRSCT